MRQRDWRGEFDAVNLSGAPASCRERLVKEHGMDCRPTISISIRIYEPVNIKIMFNVNVACGLTLVNISHA